MKTTNFQSTTSHMKHHSANYFACFWFCHDEKTAIVHSLLKFDTFAWELNRWMLPPELMFFSFTFSYVTIKSPKWYTNQLLILWMIVIHHWIQWKFMDAHLRRAVTVSHAHQMSKPIYSRKSTSKKKMVFSCRLSNKNRFSNALHFEVGYSDNTLHPLGIFT